MLISWGAFTRRAGEGAAVAIAGRHETYESFSAWLSEAGVETPPRSVYESERKAFHSIMRKNEQEEDIAPVESDLTKPPGVDQLSKKTVKKHVPGIKKRVSQGV